MDSIQRQAPPSSSMNMPLLITNYILLFVGTVSSTLLSRYYFIHKGSSRWVSTWVQTAAFPLLLLPIYIPYYLFRSTTTPRRRPFSSFTPRILFVSIFVGLLLGLNNLLFSWGNSYLPVSTSSLLLSTQLIFTLLFSFLIVKQKITFQNLNSAILLSLSSVLLGLGSSSENPSPGLTRSNYYLGFACTVGAGILFALYLPLMEKIYCKIDCYAMVVEVQAVMEAAATGFAMAGMAVSGNGFREMRRESQEVFDKGVAVYWIAVIGNAVTWQLCFMGTAGMVYLTSSITGGICMAALLGMNVLGGVVVYGEAFGGVKAVSTALCVWGFCSYGMYAAEKANKLAYMNNDNDNDNVNDGDRHNSTSSVDDQKNADQTKERLGGGGGGGGGCSSD